MTLTKTALSVDELWRFAIEEAPGLERKLR
jgi:hypothetical protein